MKYLILLAVLVLTPISQGKAHLEPYGNLGLSYSNYPPSSSGSSDFFLNYGIGGRFGYDLFAAVFGLDIFLTSYSRGNTSLFHSVVVNQPSQTKGFSQGGESVSILYSQLDESFYPISLGVFGLLDLPLFFDTYGTLFYSYGKKGKQVYHGPGLKVGMSYISAFYVQLNAELQVASFFCSSSTACSQQIQDKFYILSGGLSISLPFSADLFGEYSQISKSFNQSAIEVFQ